MTDSETDSIYNIVIDCLNLFDDLTRLKGPHKRSQPYAFSLGIVQSFPPARDSEAANISSRWEDSLVDIESEHENAERDGIKRQERSFDLWIKYTGALATVGASLDDRLRDHTEIKEMTVELLHMVQRNLQCREKTSLSVSTASVSDSHPVHVLNRPVQNLAVQDAKGELSRSPKSALPEEITQKDSQNLNNFRIQKDEALVAVDGAIDRLHFIATAIRRSSVQSQKYNLVSTFPSTDDVHFEQYVTLLVKKRFPFAHLSLCQQLSASVAARRRRLLFRAQHDKKLGTQRHITSTDSRPFKQPHAPVAGPAVPTKPVSASPVMRQEPRVKSPLRDTTLSRLDPNIMNKHLKQRPALSAASSGSTVQDSKVEYPSPPVYDDDDKYCKCTYCSEPLLTAKLKKARKYWENHVDEDLQPYICLSESCANPLLFFIHQKDWLEHMENTHSNQWTRKVHMTTWYCDIGHDLKQFEDMDSFVVHMKSLKEHPKPPTDLQISALSRRKQQIILREEYSCPICECIPDTIKPIIPRSEAKEVGRLLANHIAAHLKPLAFLLLPETEAPSLTQGVMTSQAENDSARRIRRDGSNASSPSGLDSDIANMSLSFDDSPPDQQYLSGVEGIKEELSPDINQFYEIALTKDDHWERFWQIWQLPEYDLQMDPLLQAFTLRAPPRYFHIPFCRDASFVGREAILDSVNVTIKQDALHTRVALVGLGGVGKSQIAIEYTYRIRERIPQISVFWIHASSVSRFEYGYWDIAKAARLPGLDDPQVDILQLVCNWLSDKTNGPWLMVLDNVNDDDIFFSVDNKVGMTTQGNEQINLLQRLEAFIPTSPDGSILITSRNSITARKLVRNYGSVIEVGLMTESEAMALLETRALSEVSSGGDGRALVQALEYIPLAITQAAAFISEKSITLAQCLKFFRGDEFDMQDLLSKDLRDLRRDPESPNSVLKIWRLSFNLIKEQNPQAAEMLSLMAVLDRQGIPENLLENEADRKMDVTIALGTLRAFSLVIVKDNGGGYQLHRLIQLATLNWLELQGTKEKWQEQALLMLADKFPIGEFETWTTCESLLPHAETVIQYKNIRERHAAQYSYLLRNMAHFHTQQGRYAIACTRFLTALEVQKKILGLEHLETLSTMANLAKTYERQGRWHEAEQLNTQVLEMTTRVLGKEHPDTLRSMTNLAETYLDQQRWDEAEQLSTQVLEMTTRVLGKEHPDTLRSMTNLAETYLDQQRWDEAEQLSTQVLEMTTRVLGKQHPDTLTCMANLASAYYSQARCSEAVALMDEVVNLRTKNIGPNHPYTLHSIRQLRDWSGTSHSDDE